MKDDVAPKIAAKSNPYGIKQNLLQKGMKDKVLQWATLKQHDYI